MTYREILLDLNKITDGFSLEHGAYKVPDKSDVQNAISILNNYYSEVNGKNLDYNNKEADGTDYLIIFSNPIQLEESMKRVKNEAIEKHDTLNPKLWDENNELKPEVREKIEEIAQKFDDNLKENDVELDVKDIIIVGSNANYNYSPDSDVDIHIIADTSVYPDQEDLAMKVYLAYKSLFNNKYDPTLNGIEAEIYVEPDEVHANSNGVYSLKNGWLKEPEQVDVPDIDPDHVQELIQPFEDRYNDLINNPEVSVSDVDALIDDIYLQRQTSIMKDGEFGDGNICFKEFRNRGYLQNLRDLKVELENKEMSLNDMNEQLLDIYGLNEDCDDHIDESLTSSDLFVGAEFTNPEDKVKIVVTDISDDLVTYEESQGDSDAFTVTDPISYFVSMLNEYDYVLNENCNKDLKEDIFENENGMEISFPDPRDTLAVFLEWEGIMGYTDEIYEHALEGYDALDEYLEYEGILGYTSKIYEIVNTGSAWCSQMEMEDFIGVCRALYIDYTMAIDDDDIDEKLCESGDFYLGSKWNNKNDRDRYFRTVPKYRIKDKRTNKSFTAQCGNWDSIDDVKKEYPEDKYEVKLVENLSEAKKVGLVSAAKSALNKYCDKLKDASAEEIYDRALKHASRSEYPFVKDNLTAKKDIAIDYINKRKEAMSMDDLDEDFVIDDKPGTKYRNKNGIILKMEEPTEDGEIQFAIIDNGEIIDHRKMSDLKSFARMVDANGYEKLTEDTIKQGDKWVNKGKEGTHGKFKTKKAADDQRKAMFANGYHESLDEAKDDICTLTIGYGDDEWDDDYNVFCGSLDTLLEYANKFSSFDYRSKDLEKFKNGDIDTLEDVDGMGYIERGLSEEHGPNLDAPENKYLTMDKNELHDAVLKAYVEDDPSFKDMYRHFKYDYLDYDSELQFKKEMRAAKKNKSENLNEGTAFDSIPGYMTPEKIRALNREKEAKAKAEKDAARAAKAAERKERARAERAEQRRIDQREKVNRLSYDSLADMAGLDEDNNDLTKDELLAVLRSNMSDAEILKMHKRMFEALDDEEFAKALDTDSYNAQHDSDSLGVEFKKEFDRLGLNIEDYDSYADMYRQLDQQGKEVLSNKIKSLDKSLNEAQTNTVYVELKDDPGTFINKQIYDVDDSDFLFTKDDEFKALFNALTWKEDLQKLLDEYADGYELDDFKVYDHFDDLHEDAPAYAVKYITGYAGMGVNHTETKFFRTKEEREEFINGLKNRDAAGVETYTVDNFYHDKKEKDKRNLYLDTLSEDFVISDTPGTKYKNKNGVIIEVTDPTANGEIQFYFKKDGKILDCRKVSDLKSLARLINDNGYEKIDEDCSKDLDEAVDESDAAGKALADYLGISLDDIDYVGGDVYDTPEGEYLVASEEEAYKHAVEAIKNDVDDLGLDAFTPSFRDWILNNAIDEDAINDFIDREIDYYETTEDDPDMLEFLRSLDSFDDKVSYVNDIYADDFSVRAIDFIDLDKVADEAISEDGVAHFIAFYDGDEIDLAGDLKAYRLN